MKSGRRMVLTLAILILAPWLALAGAPSRPWQDGELLSRKTIQVGRPFLRNEYVYRVRGFNCRYLVVSDTPLQLDLYTPMKFSTLHKQLFIQDVDGKEHKVRILQKAIAAYRR